MNKITFCSYPDITNHERSFALINYNNNHIKHILNSVENETTFYLLEENSPNEWLKKIQEKVKITIDCSEVSIDQLLQTCQRK